MRVSSAMVLMFTLIVALPLSLNAITAPANVVYYVNVTLTNAQNANTPLNFQQRFAFNALAICNAIICSAHLNNTIAFFPGNGTAINMWYESANGLTNNYDANSFSTSNGVIVWIGPLPGNYVPHGTSANIALGFEANTVNLFAATGAGSTGEAPQLSAIYTTYDNGNVLFPGSYWNFKGTTLPAGLTTQGTASYTISNGLTMSGTSGGGIKTTATITAPYAYDFLGALSGMAGHDFVVTGTAGYTGSGTFGVNVAGLEGFSYGANTLRICGTSNPGPACTALSPASGYGVWSATIIPQNSVGSLNYGTRATNTIGAWVQNSFWIALGPYGNGWSGYNKEQWFRIRTAEPNSVMPTWLLATVQSAASTSTTTTTTSTTTSTSTTTTVAPTCGITASNTLVNFGTIGLGLNVATQNAIQLTNTGNTASNILISGADWFGMTDSTKTYFVANTVWDADLNTPWASATHLTSSFVDTLIAVAGGAANNIYLGSAVPNNNLLTPQNYNSIITAEFSC